MTARCKIITDHCCDLPQDILDQWGVEALSFTFSEDDPDGVHGVDDAFQSVSAHQFYEAMRKGAAPHTSQPSQLDMEELFRRCIAEGVPTVYLCFSSGISGCYEGAMAVLGRLHEELGEDIPLYIVDLKLGCTPQGLLVAEAVRQRDRGLTAEEMVAWAEEARYFVHTIFLVDNLDALRRGGRIPPAAASIGTKLDVKPLLAFDLDGKLAIKGVARGRKKAIKKLAEYWDKHHDPNSAVSMVAVGNADCERDLGTLESLIRKSNDSIVFLETSIGPTIGCHVGPGMMSCCFWGADRRETASISDRIARSVRRS